MSFPQRYTRVWDSSVRSQSLPIALAGNGEILPTSSAEKISCATWENFYLLRLRLTWVSRGERGSQEAETRVSSGRIVTSLPGVTLHGSSSECRRLLSRFSHRFKAECERLTAPEFAQMLSPVSFALGKPEPPVQLRAHAVPSAPESETRNFQDPDCRSDTYLH